MIPSDCHCIPNTLYIPPTETSDFFVLHNNSGTDISFGGYYNYTYEDEKGTWREAPMQLVAFDVKLYFSGQYTLL